MNHVILKGVGAFLPEYVMSNEEIAKRVDTSDAWIKERTGIESRHIAASTDSSTSMAIAASKEAIHASGLVPDDIDLIIVSTATSEHFFPSVACKVQSALSIKKSIPAFDISAACTGFMYAFIIAEQFIRNGSAKHVLVIGSEVLSRVVDWEDRSTCILFGDGAGACVLSASETPGILASHMGADGTQADILTLANKAIMPDDASIVMNGRQVFRFAVNLIPDLVEILLKKANLTLSDIDWFIPHQANLRILKTVCEKMNFPFEKVSQDVVTQSNTSAASVPLALHRAIHANHLLPGQTVLLVGFGGGMTWAGSIVRLVE